MMFRAVVVALAEMVAFDLLVLNGAYLAVSGMLFHCPARNPSVIGPV
jgi:hypothetical protein